MPQFPATFTLLLVLASPLHAAIVAGPEREVTTPVIETAAFGQGQARIATDGDGFLAVWAESGAGLGAIHATRLDPHGKRIDETPLVISPVGSGPAVGFDGARYLVVWTQTDAVFGRFAGPDGAMSEPFQVSETSRYSASFTAPRLAFNGRVFLVTWHAYAGPAVYGGAIVDPRGHVAKTIDLGIAENYFAETAVATAHGRFYFVTRRYQPSQPPDQKPAMDVGVTVIAEDGSVSPRAIIADRPEQAFDLMAASRPGDARVAWTAKHSMDGEADGLRSVRITESGVGPVETLPTPLALETVVADASGYLAIHGDGFVRRAWRAGSGETFAIGGPPPVSVARGGATGSAGTVLVADTMPFDASSADVYAQRLDGADFEPLATAARHQSTPEIAAAGALRLAVWWESVGPERKNVIAAARINQEGQTLDETAIAVADHGGYPAPQPRVGSNGGQWLIVWLQSGTIVGMRVSRGGVLLDSEPFTIAQGVYYSTDVEVAWDGATYVVVYSTGVPSRLGGSFRILATRVTANGLAQSPAVEVVPSGQHFSPAIAASPAGSLIVWSDAQAGTLRGALLSRSDSVTPIAFPARGAVDGLAVAWNGVTGSYLVAHSSFQDAVRWTFVSATGVVTPAPAQASLPWPALAFRAPIELAPEGDRFLLTFLDRGAIGAATVNRAGFVGTGPAIVTASSAFETGFGMSGSTIVYARGTDPHRDHLSRVFVRNLEVVTDPPRRRAVR